MPEDRSESEDTEGARRLRAAFSYAKLDKSARAAALGVGERQVSRYESGETPVPHSRMEAVIAATGVPRWFFEHGFDIAPEPEEPSVAERVEALEHRLDALGETTRTDALDLLRQALADLYRGQMPSTEEGPSADAGQDRGGQSAGGAGA